MAGAEEFLGFTPSTFTDDVFNSLDQYVGDAMDALEAEVQGKLELTGRGRQVAAARSELREGCDQLTGELQKVFHLNVDKFEMYVLKNLFIMPEGHTAAPAPADVEVAGDPAELQAKVEKLKADVAEARAKHRSLNHAKRMYEKRLPGARATVEALQGAVGALVPPDTEGAAAADAPAAGAGPSTKPSVSDLVAEAAEVSAMCMRLGDAGADASAGAAAAPKGGRSRQSFGGVLSQFQRDVKTKEGWGK